MVSSKAFFVSFLVSCVLLSVYCQKAEEQGLPGIRWGRHFQKDDLTQRGGEGKLWRVMEQKRNHHYRFNGKTCKDVKKKTTSAAILVFTLEFHQFVFV